MSSHCIAVSVFVATLALAACSSSPNALSSSSAGGSDATTSSSAGTGGALTSTGSSSSSTNATTGTGGATTGSGGATTGTGGSAPTCGADILEALSTAIVGLQYISESESPFGTWSAPDSTTGPITPAHLLELLNLPATLVTDTRTLDQFFATPIADEMGAQYQALKDLLSQNLTDLTVVRIHDADNEAEIRIYVAGRTNCGVVMGVLTFAVAT
ncbi:hypothetical protein A7982_12767 [Minicystis rosea]|nr:hypothetical protein A7982_12767 [Minicystis rosea]